MADLTHITPGIHAFYMYYTTRPTPRAIPILQQWAQIPSCTIRCLRDLSMFIAYSMIHQCCRIWSTHGKFQIQKRVGISWVYSSFHNSQYSLICIESGKFHPLLWYACAGPKLSATLSMCCTMLLSWCQNSLNFLRINQANVRRELLKVPSSNTMIK